MNWTATKAHRLATAYAAGPSGGAAPAAGLFATATTWAEFWACIQPPLRARGYRRSSIIVIRQVLRGLAKCAPTVPANLTRQHVDDYLHLLVRKHSSASWLAMNISLLRTVLDRICGLSLMEATSGPKRPDSLPRIISEEEARTLLACATNLREVILLTLLYSAGLKIGEVCTLKWRDIDGDQSTIRVTGCGSSLSRIVPMPQDMHTLLGEGAVRFASDAFLFAGRREGTALSTRMAARIVRRCVRRAGLPRHVTAMTLRHSVAVHALERGVNIREVQELLGHASIETTMRYQRCCALRYPELPEPPIEQIPEAPASPTHHAPPSAKTTVTRRILAWLRPLRHPPG